ncbi:MAG: RNA-binding protein [Lachnospiraceae bacterium]|nr:RNA-binding protein [Lachnospiraceae bacterium]
MILLGKTQTLKVVKKAEIGVFVSEEGVPAGTNPVPETKPAENEIVEAARVLVPRKEAGDAKEGDLLKVFVYKDSEDRPIATTIEPKVTMGTVARLTVKDVTDIGAFLDWGLLKDLFLPFKQQTYRVAKGDTALVSLYIDKSSRLCATMKVYHFLKSGAPYKCEDNVQGLVYEIIDAFGAYVAVDDMYSALIPKKELYGDIKAGDKITARVTKVMPDGRLSLALREKSYLTLDPDGELIYNALIKAGGFLPYHDKTSPELIKSKFGLSKNAFKRAIGHLQKEGKIIIEDDGISKTEE